MSNPPLHLHSYSYTNKESAINELVAASLLMGLSSIVIFPDSFEISYLGLSSLFFDYSDFC